MNLTKRERRLLSRKENIRILWLGIATILFSVALSILAFVKWKEADAIWQRNIAMVERVDTGGTETEIKLRQGLLARTQSLRDLDKARLEEKAQKGFFIFFNIGIMCIGLHFRTRVYHRLFERLQSAPQAAPPATPG